MSVTALSLEHCKGQQGQGSWCQGDWTGEEQQRRQVRRLTYWYLASWKSITLAPGEGKGSPLQYSGLENSMDCSPLGRKESDMTERLSLTHSSRLPLSHLQTVPYPCPQPEDTKRHSTEQVHDNICRKLSAILTSKSLESAFLHL